MAHQSSRLLKKSMIPFFCHCCYHCCLLIHSLHWSLEFTVLGRVVVLSGQGRQVARAILKFTSVFVHKRWHLFYSVRNAVWSELKMRDSDFNFTDLLNTFCTHRCTNSTRSFVPAPPMSSSPWVLHDVNNDLFRAAWAPASGCIVQLGPV